MSSRNSSITGKPLCLNWEDLAGMIDHTNLRPEATPNDINRLCEEAREIGFGAVMINSGYVDLACSKLRNSDVAVGTVVGFPLGASLTSVKVFEASACLDLGAREIDMVMNIGAIKAANHDGVLSDIRAVAEIVHGHRSILKVILEAGLLNDEEKLLACELSEKAGADFVKTSTGFLGGGATVEDVALMRRAVRIGVKASGGIRSLRNAQAMVDAGATRLGTSSGVNIIRELQSQSSL